MPNITHESGFGCIPMPDLGGVISSWSWREGLDLSDSRPIPVESPPWHFNGAFMKGAS